MDQRIIDLYDEYTHAPLERRVFMERLIGLVGSIAAAQGALALIEPAYAQATTVAENDARIMTSRVARATAGIDLYLAEPAGGPRAPGLVIVVHENRGLNPHIQDVARRFAAEGFITAAPDFLSELGGTPADPDAARAAFAKLPADDSLRLAAAAVTHLSGRYPGRKVGMVGFCWGGGLVNRAATAIPTLSAGVVFYGVAPDLARVPEIRATLLLNHAALDERVNATLPPYEAALKAAGKRYTLEMYPGVNHAFFNDTSAERYDATAAARAWTRTLEFFRKELA